MVENCVYANNCSCIDCKADFCLKKYKLDALYSYGLLPDKQKQRITLRIDNDEKNTDLEEFKQLSAIEKDIVNFVKAGKNLYIHSSQAGNGKTSWAIRLLQAYLDKIWLTSDLTCRVLFLKVSTFFDDLKNNISSKNMDIEVIKANIMEADIVVFDDIATKCGTVYEISQLLNYIDSRIIAGKSNIYTSNLNQKEMFSALGERLTSRITNYAKDIELHGADKRNIGGNN